MVTVRLTPPQAPSMLNPLTSPATRPFLPADPRRPNEAVPFSLPLSYPRELFDPNVPGMLLAGGAMLTRSPWFVWASLFALVSAMANKSIFTPKDASAFGGGFSAWLFALTAGFAVYLPILMGAGRPN